MAQETKEMISRRGFLGWLWRLMGILLAGQGAYLGLSFLASRKPAANTGQVVTAGTISDFRPGTVTPFDAARFFLVRFQDGGFLALHSKCTHLACVVGWENARLLFACPCHGSAFHQDGSVANPPAPRPLDRYPITIGNDGRIQVDTSTPIVRSAINGSDLIYPSALALAQATTAATATR